jgi:hypothetical protein
MAAFGKVEVTHLAYRRRYAARPSNGTACDYNCGIDRTGMEKLE